ncbi:MAG: SET domain-containing protein [Nanoarchaeota archaeon]|nr:SET domain-containing protein [Nanoarchaeota archaeon]
MLFVKTYLDTSKIHGIGLFAGEAIPKGTLIWKFVPGFDVIVSVKEFNAIPKVAQAWISRYGYKNGVGHVICVDDARFFNHADDHNTDDSDLEKTVAKRDIRKGEELTSNYFSYDAAAKLKFGKRK